MKGELLTQGEHNVAATAYAVPAARLTDLNLLRSSGTITRNEIVILRVPDKRSLYIDVYRK